MYLPSNPKVAIIDDKIDEVAPLFSVFSKAGIPFIYCDGKEQSFPIDGFPSIRLLVLDIDIKGGAFNEKTAASICANAINKIIKYEKQLYCIVFWTHHSNIKKLIIKNLETINKEPIGSFDWDKSELSRKSSEDLISALSIKINEGIKEKAFEFLVFWENKIAQDTSKFTHLFERIPREAGKTRNDLILSILSKLACSYTGKDKLDDSEKNIVFATKKLNSGFIDYLRYDDFNYSLNLPLNASLSLTDIAVLNSLLFVDEKNGYCQIENGSVLEVDDEDLFESLKGDLPANISLKDGAVRLVGVVVTPACDLAYSKVLRKASESDSYYHRVLYGLQIDLSNDSISGINCLINLNARKKEKKEAIERLKECFYNEDKKEIRRDEIENCFSKINISFPLIPERLLVTEPLHIGGENKIIIFNFASFSTRLLSSKEKVLFQLKSTFVHDLQTKIAIHVNRLGNDMIRLS